MSCSEWITLLRCCLRSDILITNSINIEMQTFHDHSSIIDANTCFVDATLGRQHSVAMEVRAINNRDRVLYDRCFVTAKVIRHGDYRVEVDCNGREAILSVGAQKCFSPDQYYQHVSHLPSVVRVGDSVLLSKA